jgi:hypothetical protein
MNARELDLMQRLLAQKKAHDLARQYGFRDRKMNEPIEVYERELLKHIYK